MDRVYHYYLGGGRPAGKSFLKPADAKAKLPSWTDVRALGIVVWPAGNQARPAGRFWRYMCSHCRKNPSQLEAIPRGAAQTSHFHGIPQVVTMETRRSAQEPALRAAAGVPQTFPRACNRLISWSELPGLNFRFLSGLSLWM